MSQLSSEQQQALQEKLQKMSPEELLEFQKQQCIFCQIISGKVPAKKVFEDSKCLAVLDIHPAARGHVLLLPKEHYSIMPQMPEEEISYLFKTAKKLSQLLLRALRVEGTTVFIANGIAAGQKAQHFMIHVIPRKEGDKIMDIKETIFGEEESQNVYARVSNKLNPLLGVKKEVVPEVPVEKKAPVVKKELKEKKEVQPAKIPVKMPVKEVQPTPEKIKGKVSLDDIADLFK